LAPTEHLQDLQDPQNMKQNWTPVWDIAWIRMVIDDNDDVAYQAVWVLYLYITDLDLSKTFSASKPLSASSPVAAGPLGPSPYSSDLPNNPNESKWFETLWHETVLYDCNIASHHYHFETYHSF
jgi:hypothetical protein